MLAFEWNDEKSKANFKKHGIWFEEARTVWSDPHAIEFFDSDHSANEDRFIRVGTSSRHKTLLIVFSEKHGGEVIRIVSARKLTNGERKQYEEGV